ncbi:MAG: mannosyltransferase putative-domain-containing protein [Benniella sp.]|nr:MAG: mannosyltransferase putative-domain-containing protein [Benniella sp.]
MQMLKLDYAKNEKVDEHKEKINFAELARAERLYKGLWNYVHPIFQGLSGRDDNEREKALVEMAKTRPEIDYFLRLEKRLFPWAHLNRQTSFSLQRTFKGRGLVFCAGNGQFEFVVTAIQALRSRLKSQLPIQVFHMGDSDLSPDRQQYLKDMTSNVEVMDVTQILDNGYMQLGGWAIKPFAMLASRFEEVMFVDADAYFLQDPVVLFDDPGYQATGALFFYDRTLFARYGSGAEWLRSVTPLLSSFVPMSRMFRWVSAHEQESGVVMINKRTRFTGLMAVCKSNGKWERDLVSYRVFHGDKETFWTGFEMIQEPYAFMRNYGGVIGELRPDNQNSVCGAQLHEDHKGRPLWWNGGLYRNKNEGITRYLTFDYWMTGGGHQKHRERFTYDEEGMKKVLQDLGLSSEYQLQLEAKDAEWDFKESCLAGAKVNTLSQREKKLANGYVGIDKVAREDAKKMNEGKKVDPKSHNWDTV